jgi:transcription antitermination factor NusG
VTPNPDGDRWYALQVRTRWEFSASSLLRGKGFETFLPTYLSKRQSSGRQRQTALPLFPGYVFCHFDAQKRLPILITPGVISVVGSGKIPLPLDDAEIAAIQTVAQSGLPAQPWPYLEIGERVRIEDHALLGLEGILLSFRGAHRLIVSVSLLRRSVALQIDRSLVVPIRSGRPVRDELLPSSSLFGEGIA